MAKEVAARFAEIGNEPLEGEKLLTRWYDVAGGRGFAVIETDDAAIIAKHNRLWTDLLTFEVVPVINDEQLAAIRAS